VTILLALSPAAWEKRGGGNVPLMLRHGDTK
jgi:hypothetical protein